MRRRVLPRAALLLGLLALLAGCGGEPRTLDSPRLGRSGDEADAPQQLGFPAFATKNTTRVGGADAIADAAAVARAVYPGGAPGTQPRAVVLADQRTWQAGLAAAVLMSSPLRAPLLLSDGGELPQASADALEALAPTGASELGGAQVVRVGDAPAPAGYRSSSIAGEDPIALAAAIDRLQSAAVGQPSRAVVIASADAPAFAMPAAGWAAKTGNPLLYVRRDTIPGPTFAALQTHRRPRIYLLGPVAEISARVADALRGIGTVTRIAGDDPVTSAIAFARYRDGQYGWGVDDPGHGVVFANARRTLDAAAAAPLSASGTYGPLLLIEQADTLPLPVGQYLLDIQPGYTRDPVRAVYNHGWLMGDESAISLPVQSRIDSLLEIAPIEQNDAIQMSQAERPDRLRPEHDVTVEDVRQLMGASTPHFALQLRERIRRLIAPLPADHPARLEGEREIARLNALARAGEVRGQPAEPGMAALASVDPAA